MVESIKNMTMPLGERIEKIKSNLATTRFKPNAFFDNIISVIAVLCVLVSRVDN